VSGIAAHAAAQSSASGWLLLAVIAFAVCAAWKLRKWWRKKRKG
jgi:membrane protein DedA with SNARE-associated domain